MITSVIVYNPLRICNKRHRVIADGEQGCLLTGVTGYRLTGGRGLVAENSGYRHSISLFAEDATIVYIASEQPVIVEPIQETVDCEMKLTVKQIGVGKFEVHAAGYTRFVIATFVPGYDHGGNDYRTPRWVLHQPGQTFPFASHVSEKCRRSSIPAALVKQIKEVIEFGF